MTHNNYNRRDVLKLLAGGATAFTGASCAYISHRTVERIPFTFAQLCDPQLGMGGYEHDVKTFRQAVKQINKLKPDFAVICGDLVNTPDEKSFADFNAIKAGFTIPCYCAPGNHDVGAPSTPALLKNYRKLVGKDYDSFEHNGYTFVVVNTQLWKAPLKRETEKHDHWLNGILKKAADKGSPVFIVGHYPLYLGNSYEEEGYFNIAPQKRRELLSLFEESGVAAFLAGHTHTTIINDYQNIQLVNGETTSKNFDERPFGFRLWRVSNTRPFEHVFVPLIDGS